MPSVDIETSIPSYYYETRKDQIVQAWRDITRRWWNLHRSDYRVVTSTFVVTELEQAPMQKASRAIQLLRDVEVLSEPRTLDEVIQYYIDHRLMPKAAGGDAAHVAMTSLHNIDFLLTWNCQHLANANKIRHLGVLNGRLGLPVPIITTPLTLVPEEMP